MTTSPTPSDGPFRLALASRISEFDRLADSLSAWGEAAGVPARTLGSVVLILDELFANVVMHGYRNDPSGEVEVEARVGPGQVDVTITDHAPAFNPLQVPEPDTTLGIDEREIGGLGLLFVRRTADTLDYALGDADGARPVNVLKFTKRFA